MDERKEQQEERETSLQSCGAGRRGMAYPEKGPGASRIPHPDMQPDMVLPGLGKRSQSSAGEQKKPSGRSK